MAEDQAPETAPESYVSERTEAVAARRLSRLDEGRPAAVEKQRRRQRMTARERVDQLLDDDSFLEYGVFAEAANPELDAPADGVVTGMGAMSGSPVAVVAADYTVYGGSQGVVGHHKVDRVLELAIKNYLPLIVLAEGGGARAQEVGGRHDIGARITTFRHMAELSGKVPTVAVVAGPCFAGSANMAAFCDCIIATRDAALGVAGPPLVRAATGATMTPEEIGPATMHSGIGNIDVLCDDDAEAIELAQEYLDFFIRPDAEPQAPELDPQAVGSLLPDNPRRAYDMWSILRSTFDEDSFFELRAGFASSVITTLARLDGMAVGVIASQPKVRAGALDAMSSDKIARFIQLCGAYGIPIVFLVDTPGNMVGPDAEATGLLRHSVRPSLALANTGVPFFTVIVRKCFGLAAFVMGSRLAGPELHLCWPTAEFGVMGMEGAANILDKGDSEARREATLAELRAGNAPLTFAADFRTDDVIDPATTRETLIRGMRLARRGPEMERGGRTWIDSW